MSRNKKLWLPLIVGVVAGCSLNDSDPPPVVPAAPAVSSFTAQQNKNGAAPTIPFYTLSSSTGDRGDVESLARYDETAKKWKVLMRRQLSRPSNVVFSLGVVDNGHNHVGAPTVELDFTPSASPSATKVVSAKVNQGAIRLDGRIDEWNTSKLSTIPLTNMNNFPLNLYPAARPHSVTLGSAYDDEFLYFVARWQDQGQDPSVPLSLRNPDGSPQGTQSSRQNQWVFDGSSWNKRIHNADDFDRSGILANGRVRTYSGTESEDRLFLWFPIVDLNQDFKVGGAGCTTSCHVNSDQDASGLLAAMRQTIAGDYTDIWHWKAARGARGGRRVGIADDKVLIYTPKTTIVGRSGDSAAADNLATGSQTGNSSRGGSNGRPGVDSPLILSLSGDAPVTNAEQTNNLFYSEALTTVDATVPGTALGLADTIIRVKSTRAFALTSRGSVTTSSLGVGAVSVALQAATSFSAAGGTGSLEGDLFQYTGISTNALTGVTGLDKTHPVAAVAEPILGGSIYIDGDRIDYTGLLEDRFVGVTGIEHTHADNALIFSEPALRLNVNFDGAAAGATSNLDILVGNDNLKDDVRAAFQLSNGTIYIDGVAISYDSIDSSGANRIRFVNARGWPTASGPADRYQGVALSVAGKPITFLAGAPVFPSLYAQRFTLDGESDPTQAFAINQWHFGTGPVRGDWVPFRRLRTATGSYADVQTAERYDVITTTDANGKTITHGFWTIEIRRRLLTRDANGNPNHDDHQFFNDVDLLRSAVQVTATTRTVATPTVANGNLTTTIPAGLGFSVALFDNAGGNSDRKSRYVGPYRLRRDISDATDTDDNQVLYIHKYPVGFEPTSAADFADAGTNVKARFLVPTIHANDTSRARNLRLLAGVDGNQQTLYIYAEWDDATRSIDKKRWVWNSKTEKFDKGAANEDRLVIMFNNTVHPSFFETGQRVGRIAPNSAGVVLSDVGDGAGFNGGPGCAILCHIESIGGSPVEVMHSPAPSEIIDTWHWKAARGGYIIHPDTARPFSWANNMGWADDKWMGAEKPTGTVHDDIEAAHHGDLGSGSSSDNNAAGQPKFMAAKDPGASVPFLYFGLSARGLPDRVPFADAGIASRAGTGGTGSTSPTAPAVSYRTDVQPIFDGACTSCHGTQGGLNLGSRATLLAGGTSGSSVIVGNGDGSLLVKRLNGSQPPVMPTGGRLTSAQIKTISDWIDQGAKDN